MSGEPYLSGNYAPQLNELTASDLKVIGELPRDICGIFVRNGANTDLVFHAGQLLALRWLGGKAHVSDLPSLETNRIQKYGGALGKGGGGPARPAAPARHRHHPELHVADEPAHVLRPAEAGGGDDRGALLPGPAESLPASSPSRAQAHPPAG